MFYLLLLIFVNLDNCRPQLGPDPWNHYDPTLYNTDIKADFPPDIKLSLKRASKVSEAKVNGGISEWSFKRTLAMFLKGGQTKRHEDGTIDVSVQMKFQPEQWETLDGYLKSDISLTEDMFRRALGYIEGAIYKPSIMENIVAAWTDYIEAFLINYKMHLTWTLVGLSMIVAAVWLWNHPRHLIIVLVAVFYFYEVFVSYKEVEQQELEKFLNAINSCSWYFWKSTCEVPTPDLLAFLKHMNPMKIAIRMLTTLVTEPIVTVSGTVKTVIQNITDELWFPFDKIVYGILLITINVLLIFFFIIILFNYILNIPFNLSFLGLASINIKQRKRNILSQNRMDETPRIENIDRIGGTTLNKILDVCSQALNNASQNRNHQRVDNVPNILPRIKRSSSTGRLPNPHSNFQDSNHLPIEYNVRKRNVATRFSGGGDAF